MSRRPLDDDEIRSQLELSPAWTREGDHIHRRFEFPNFVAAWAFMSGAALIAERMNHHPDWSNVYGRVDVRLSTHDAGGLTALDFELAIALDALVAC